MNVGLFVLAAVAGGVGAAVRYVLDNLLTRVVRAPWGIFVINVCGSFLLGVLTGFQVGEGVALVVGAGLLGGFTTFSAVSVTSVLLSEEQRTGLALMNVLGTFIVAVGAAWGGLALGQAIV
ncbi:fluoride efflux transporter CrcB [Microbacterium sediminicola]|uniref:Fluoride-specific ion channel FluC n=1 Tax=Microbacterium sediminicola TaxID=415210 RepID=A0ABN2IGU6_9MICO